MSDLKNIWLVLPTAALLIAGCSVHTRGDKEDADNKDVTISSPFGGLKVKTDDVDAKDTGLSIYPGAKEKPNDNNDDDKKKADVNIDTPWFAVKVVAVTFTSADSVDKVWDFYKKDMARHGRVLECKKGSPDMDLRKSDKNDITCEPDKRGHDRGLSIRTGNMELKVGSEDKQRIVAVKSNGSGSEFTLLYVQTRGGKESM